MIHRHVLLIIFLNKSKVILLHTVNDSKYCYVSLTIQLNISHLFTQLNDQTVPFQKNQFSISHLFTLSLHVKQFYLTNR